VKRLVLALMVDLFDLVLTSDGWKIIGIADTRSNEGCRG